MRHKNKIKFSLQEVSENQTLEIDGISFSNIAYVLVFIDGVNLFTLDSYQESFLVFEELQNSILKSGKYLLFTGVSGIADDAGWEYVDVLHDEDLISWKIQRDDNILLYIFEKSHYLTAISVIEKEIQNLSRRVKLEPSYIVYPE